MRGYTLPVYAGSNYFVGACEAIRDIGPGDFMVSPGDIDPPDQVRKTLDAVLGEDYVWYPVVGNHELEKPEYMSYLRMYNKGGVMLPGIVHGGPSGAVETCYSFDHGNAHCVVINQYYDGKRDDALDGEVPEPLYNWLEDDLKNTGKKFIFVFGHEPLVSSPDLDNGRVRHRGDSLDKYPESSHRFWQLMRKHKVVAYFCGHTHNTSVCKINGIWQIDAGHARGQGDPGARSTFMQIHVGAGSVRCDVYRDDAEGGRYTLTFSEYLR